MDSEIKKFISDERILTTIIGAILSSTLSNFTTSLIKNLILPIFDIDINNDGISETQNLKDIKYTYKNMEFNVGIFLSDMLELIIIFSIIYIIIKKYLD